MWDSTVYFCRPLIIWSCINSTCNSTAPFNQFKLASYTYDISYTEVIPRGGCRLRYSQVSTSLYREEIAICWENDISNFVAQISKAIINEKGVRYFALLFSSSKWITYDERTDIIIFVNLDWHHYSVGHSSLTLYS